MDRLHALDQSDLLFHVHPMPDNSCYQTTSIRIDLQFCKRLQRD